MNTIKSETNATYLVSTAEQDVTIKEALTILKNRLVTKGAAFTSPDTVKQYLVLNSGTLEHEIFSCLFLDNQHKLIEYKELFRGTIDGASVYSREVAKEALKLNAAAVIFSHNHPSGIVEPSQADRNITNKLKEALALLDVRVLDHIIVGGIDTYAFSEHGLI